MMKRIDYFIPTRIVFGAGRLKELATLSLPGKKALLCVTEDKLMEKLGIQQRVIELLGQNGVSVAVFDKVTPNPTRTGVMAAAALAKESGCDFVIGLGGGSSIDTAKAASIMMANPATCGITPPPEAAGASRSPARSPWWRSPPPPGRAPKPTPMPS